MNEMKNDYEIKCPKCGTIQSVGLHQCIDAESQPELKDQLLSNQINIIDCVGCEHVFRIDSPMIYRDDPRKVAVLCLPFDSEEADFAEESVEEQFTSLQSALQKDLDCPHVELVFSHSELIERVFMLEHRMDTRIIEYIKYLMHTRNPDQLNPTSKRLLFNADQSDDENLLFIVQDLRTRELEGILQYRRAAYEELDDLFDHDSLTPDLMEMFPGPHISAHDLLVREAQC